MNARETIAYHLWTAILSSDDAEAKATTEQLLDDYRAEILTEAKVETVAWLVKKAAEGYDVGGLASKVDRGAVRIFIGTAHYRDALDAHRAEVLAGDGQEYDGELVMLRGLLATLHAVAEHGDLTDVRKLLAEHRHDDEDARHECKPADGDADRRSVLLSEIRMDPSGRWKSGRAVKALRARGFHPVSMSTASHDLAALAAAGHLVMHEEPGVRWYEPKPGGRS